MNDRSRAAEITIDIDAPLEDTWRALTDPRELTRWFPLQAMVEGRTGGTMTWRWDDQFVTVSRIETWQPSGRLRLVQEREAPHGADGRSIDDEPPGRMLMEFVIETHEGKTRLHLVHSGFGSGAAWDDELEGVRNGWSHELRSLAHYLTRHRGRDRHVGWAKTTTAVSHADVWSQLTGPGGFGLTAAMLPAGAPFACAVPGGGRLTGVSQLHIPDRDWVGVADELDDGLVRLSSWRGGGQTGVQVWFSTWSPALASRVRELGEAAQRLLDHRLGPAEHDVDEPRRTS